MSKPKTLRIVPATRIMKANPAPDETDLHWQEGIAADVPTEEAEHLLGLKIAVEVEKGEIEAGTPVEVLTEAVLEAAAAAEPVPEVVQVVLPAGDPVAPVAPAKSRRAG